MQEYSYTSGHLGRGGIGRYRRNRVGIAGQVAGGILGAAAIGAAGYGIYKGIQAISKFAKNRKALNTKAHAMMTKAGVPNTRLNRRYARAKIKGDTEMMEVLKSKFDAIEKGKWIRQDAKAEAAAAEAERKAQKDKSYDAAQIGIRTGRGPIKRQTGPIEHSGSNPLWSFE